MINTSTLYKNSIGKNRQLEYDVRIVFVDGSQEQLRNRNLLGLSVKDAVSGTSSFDIGSAIVNQVDIKIDNTDGRFDDYDFTGATVTIKVGLALPNGTTEWLNKGTFTAEPGVFTGAVITVKATDNMTRFDQPYTLSKLTYPATLGAIVRDACSCCEVQLAADSAAFEQSDFVVDARPDDKSTFREILSYVGEISCHWCRCNANGQLSLGWYDQASYEGLRITDAGTLAAPASDKIDAGTFASPAADVIDSGTFASRKAFHHIYSLAGMTISTDDVVITGIRVVEKSSGDEEEDIAYQTGEDGYVLTIQDNKLIQGKGQEVAAYLGRKLIGLRFRPLSVSCLSDPSIEAGDIAYVTDRKGRSYATLITSTTFQAGNYQQISCSAESPARNSATRYSKYTQVYQELRKNISRQKTEWEKAIEQLDQRLSTSSGLYSTIETQADGGSIYYLHDKPSLSESMIVWKMTAEAWGMSTDGGKTWNGGMTVDGEVIARILTSIGINADWINTGALVIRDSEGNILFNADVDTGRIDIVADSFSLRGKTIEEMAQAELNDFVSAVYGPDIEGLQAQIDGQIESYYYDYEPSLQNYPASQWTTTEERKKHEGDIFYWKSMGYAYRFLLDGATWKWQLIQDADITKAIASAEKAQDTADGKRRVFVVTPQPPYDIGDLWAQGSGGDMMRCRVSRSTGTYVSTDWEKASKYTDDSKLNNFITGEFAESVEHLQSQADKKAETWYQSSDPALNWNPAQKAEHKGDIWYNTGEQKTYIYNGSRWDESKTTPPDSVFNKIDGKAQIFVETPYPPYDIGDLWAQGSTGDLMRCRVARSSGGYTSTDWEKASKYTDDTKANQAITMLQDKSGNYYGSYAPTLSNSPASSWSSSEYYDHDGDVFFNPSTGDVYVFRYGTTSRWSLLPKADAQEIVKQLDQQTIFNILTNNGQTQGLILSGGKVYLNGEYLRASTVSSTAIVDGAVTETKIKGGSVTTQKLAAKAVTADKIDVTDLYALAAYIGSWRIYSNYLEATNGYNEIQLDAQNARIRSIYDGGVIPAPGGKGYSQMQGNTVWSDYLEGVEASVARMKVFHSVSAGGAYLQVGVSASNNSFLVNESGHCGMKLPTISGGYPVVAETTAGNGVYQIRKNSSSSKRYKSIRKMVKSEEVDSLYTLPVDWFVYKEGYLDENDERYGVEIPGFIAEELEARLPIAVNHLDGRPENWNETIMIPCMLKLIQDQKKELDALKEEVYQIKQMLGGGEVGDQ